MFTRQRGFLMFRRVISTHLSLFRCAVNFSSVDMSLVTNIALLLSQQPLQHNSLPMQPTISSFGRVITHILNCITSFSQSRQRQRLSSESFVSADVGFSSG